MFDFRTLPAARQLDAATATVRLRAAWLGESPAAADDATSAHDA